MKKPAAIKQQEKWKKCKESILIKQEKKQRD